MTRALVSSRGIQIPILILCRGLKTGIFQKMRYGKKTRRVNIPLRVTARDLKNFNCDFQIPVKILSGILVQHVFWC